MRTGTRYSLRKKPCPACKAVDPYRPADEICKACAKLIEEAKAAREAARKMGGTELVNLPWAAQAMDHIPHSSVPFGEDYGRNIRSTIYEMLHLIGVQSPGEKDKAYSAPSVIGEARSYYEGGVVRFPKGLQPLFERLYENIIAATENAYAKGYGDGHHMLVRLAKGEMSTEQFNEIGSGNGLQETQHKRRKRRG